VKSPYPYCNATDIMPPAAGQMSKLNGRPLPSLPALAAQLRSDKIAGMAAAAFVKYLNWEPSGPNQGDCWHDSWQPAYQREKSDDRGHIHVSGRSDMVTSALTDGYDLVARTLGDDMPLDNSDKAWLTGTMVPAIVRAMQNMPVRATDRDLETVLSDMFAGEQSPTSLVSTTASTYRQAQLNRIEAALTADAATLAELRTALDALPGAVVAQIGSVPGVNQADLESAVNRATADVLSNVQIPPIPHQTSPRLLNEPGQATDPATAQPAGMATE
jgi:hypothetical protein